MNNTYSKLFNFRLKHHYFLDEGEDVYGVDMTSEMEAVNYKLYDIYEFLDVIPTERTELLLKNLRGRFIKGKDGFSVVIKADPSDGDYPFIEFDSNMFFDFIVKVRDPFFENYTEIEIDRSKLVYMSNGTPVAADVDSETASAIQHVLFSDFGNAYADMNIELNDVISSNELLGAFGLIRMHLDGEGSEIDLSDGAGKFAGIPVSGDRIVPEVELVFTNRNTTWRFKDTSDGSVLYETSDELPLTKNGYIKVKNGNDEYPNPTVNLIVREETQQGMNTIVNYYSEVFI